MPRGVASVGDGVDDFFAAVDAVAAAVDLRISGGAGSRIGDDASARVERDARELARDLAELRLSDRQRDDVARDLALGAGWLSVFHLHDAHAAERAGRIANEGDRLRVRDEADAFFATALELVLVAA